MSTAPGWFPDPSGQASWRWWDGTRWTEHVAGPTSGGSPLAAQWHHHVASGVEQERKAGRAARIALVVYAVMVAATAFLMVPMLTDLREAFREIIANPEAPPPALPFNPVPVVAAQALAPFQYGALIFMMIWVHRAATVAQQLRIPARRSPAWAVGAWFIPIVNVWWPCQSLRDMLPHSEPARDRITWIWVVAVIGGLMAAAGLGIAFVSTPAAWAVALTGAAMQVVASLLGRGVVADVLAAHERAVQSRPSGATQP